MKALDYQLQELMDSTESQHGFWLKNHQSVIEETLKSGIVTYGLRTMVQRLDDYKSPYVQNLYKKIEESKS